MSTVISHSRAWLSRPIAYTICAPLLTITGAATTIAAPILLTPAGFSSFILLMSVYQYIADLRSRSGPIGRSHVQSAKR